ncbi:hypothetical protein ACJX0J_020525, partial [Zea mays]
MRSCLQRTVNEVKVHLIADRTKNLKFSTPTCAYKGLGAMAGQWLNTRGFLGERRGAWLFRKEEKKECCVYMPTISKRIGAHNYSWVACCNPIHLMLEEDWGEFLPFSRPLPFQPLEEAARQLGYRLKKRETKCIQTCPKLAESTCQHNMT